MASSRFLTGWYEKKSHRGGKKEVFPSYSFQRILILFREHVM